MDVKEEVLEGFWHLFRGRVDAWGSVEGRCNKEQVIIAHYAEHLKGMESLGIYPLLDDGTCHFAAVDIDEKDFNKALAIRKEFLNQGINSYIAESKSKGYHVYTFAEERFIARDIRGILNHTLSKLDIRAEVFPKQDRLSETTPLGNYINLPCFGHTRPFLSADLREVPVEIALQKIKRVSQATIDLALKGIPSEQPRPQTEVRPSASRGSKLSCFGAMMAGVPQGCRDEVAFRLAVHLYRQGMPQQLAEATMLQWDIDYNQPPIGSAIVRRKIKQAYTGKYGLGCLNPLIQQFCNLACPIYQKRHKEIDFRKGEEGRETIIALSRVKTSPPAFSLHLDGAKLEMDSNDLLSLRKVKAKAIEELSYVPFPGMKAAEWEALVNSLLAEITNEPAPQDASSQARCVEALYDWLGTTPEAESPEDVEAGKPIKREDACYFRMKDALDHLSKYRWFQADPGQVYRMVKNAGGGAKSARLGRVFKLWFLPIRKEEEEKEDV